MIKTGTDTERIASDNLVLKYLIREPDKKSAKKKAVILLHGVGSNEKDLFSLAPQLPQEFFIISPRGPYTLGEGRYAWYNVDFSTGKPIINAEQETASRELIRTFIREIKQNYDLDEVYLGGFSQGAIMSYSIGLIHPTEVQGIITLSGRILDEIKPFVKKDDYLQKLRIFIAHGIQDNTLPIHYARAAKDYIDDLGAQLTYHEYPIAHQINNQVLLDLNNWLQETPANK
ncbi:alpha/beta hydrolase [Flavihumibacter sp. ZG627]|uniref:alpha/beta hydrolase n=1 Tax=Flavihumibacter sp. ZG627 TaxID=1463156 RepID=UPI000694ECC8|nr:esterase [Flavihumibacter sp. ZG627]